MTSRRSLFLNWDIMLNPCPSRRSRRPVWPTVSLACFCWISFPVPGGGQEYGPRDRDNPGDAMIQAYLRGRAECLERGFAEEIDARDEWRSRLPGFGQDEVTERRLRFLIDEWKSRLPRYREE